MSTNNSQVLPPREASMFKKILKHFKEKQFKNGLKVANQILSNPKHSEHGETLAMKGLILNSMGKRTEAFDYVKRGLRNDLKSHVCWHVYGLLQKSDHKYEDAIKSYRNALRLKKDSVQILSDLSLVQIHTRDLEGYRDSRYQLFLLRPGERSTWIGCAMAYHLTGDHMTAVNLLSEYQNSSNQCNHLRNNRGTGGRRQINEIYELSELFLYSVFILMEVDRYNEALAILEEHEVDIVDKVAYFEYKVQIYLATGRFQEAEKVLLSQLIARNPENASYFELLEKAKQIGSEEDRLKLYEELAGRYPRSQTIARLPITFASNLEVFQSKIEGYLKQGFRKGRPALFRDLKYLYQTELARCLASYTYSKLEEPLSPRTPRADLEVYIQKLRHIKVPPKIQVIENLLLSYVENLKTRNRFDTNQEEEESVTCLLWVYYFLAQHFDALKEFAMAFHFVNCALAHTPTLIDIFVIKAKIFKHAGFPEKAAKCLEEAQSLDTSDRYLNSKCAKYLIRINKVKEAEEMCLKFTREGVSAAENLNEMQCMWYQTEVANAYRRMGALGEALKKCVEIDNHFLEINEDQFDFNTYCILKVTLRSYVQMIRLEDTIRCHRFFINAAKTAVDIYLRLYDSPISSQSETDNDADSKLSASELRKLRNKQRKAMHKANAERENDKSSKRQNEKRDAESKSETVEYIDPVKLEKTEDPLSESMRFLIPAKIFGSSLPEVHLLAFEVYLRQGKLLLQLQSLRRAYRRCSPTSSLYPTLLRHTCLFLYQLYARREELPTAVVAVFDQILPTMDVFGVKDVAGDQVDIFAKLPSVEDYIERYFPANSKSLLVRLERLQVKNYLARQSSQSSSANDTSAASGKSTGKPAALPETLSMLSQLMAEIDTLTDLSLDNCHRLYELARSGWGQVPPEVLEQLRGKLHQLYPFASRFVPSLEVLEKEFSDFDYFTAEPEEYYNCIMEEN